jgi:Protein of unknown function (DUF3716)
MRKLVGKRVATNYTVLSLDRSQNADACWYQIYGEQMPEGDECAKCKATKGPFAECRVVDGLSFCGNCQYGGKASSCTLNSMSTLSYAVVHIANQLAAAVSKKRKTPGSVFDREKLVTKMADLVAELPSKFLRKTAEMLVTVADAKDAGAFQGDDEDELSE